MIGLKDETDPGFLIGAILFMPAGGNEEKDGYWDIHVYFDAFTLRSGKLRISVYSSRLRDVDKRSEGCLEVRVFPDRTLHIPIRDGDSTISIIHLLRSLEWGHPWKFTDSSGETRTFSYLSQVQNRPHLSEKEKKNERCPDSTVL